MWIDKLATRWWFGHTLVLGLSVGVLVLAVLMTPSDEILQLFGFDVPMMCAFRAYTGYPCPGCGLTRSFVFLAHGQPLSAAWMNPMGPPLFLLMLSQIPYRVWRLRQGPPPRLQRRKLQEAS